MRMGRFRHWFLRRNLGDLAAAPDFPNRRNAMNDPNRNAQFASAQIERHAAQSRSDARDAASDRNTTVARLRARAARCADLAAQATSLGLAKEFDLLARDYEADAASLEFAALRR
jgi:hypothetical protein